MSDKTTVDLTALRAPFKPEYVGKLPRVTCRACSDGRCGDHKKVKCAGCDSWISERHIHIDYVGHADVTSRLLEVDPEWNWEPKAEDEHGLPVFDADKNGSPVGLWIRLTVGGVTRLGYGSCPSNQSDAVKVLIGDALRNASMRFGVALDLWAKGDRADPTAENATASGGQPSRRGGGQPPADAWENAKPAPPRQNGNDGNGQQQRGQVSRPAQPQAASPVSEEAPEDIDPDAQAFADEAHGAISLKEMEDIQRRAREAKKLLLFVRNPSVNGTGKPGKLAIYLDWKRKQVKETEDALTELNAVVDETGFPVAGLETHVQSVTGTDLESASAAQLRQAAQAMRVMQEPAA
jgi:hypothetical protein